MTSKPSYSSFFSAWCTDFKILIFEKIHWAPSKVIVFKRSFSRSLRTSIGFHLVFTIFIYNFCRFRFWGCLTSATSEWAQGIFSKIIFLKSVHSKEKYEACLSLLVKIFTKSVHRGGVSPFKGHVLNLKSFCQNLILSWAIRYSVFQLVKFVSSFELVCCALFPNFWHLVVKFGYNK